MFLKNSLKLVVALAFVCAACGCDLKMLKALRDQSNTVDNSVTITDSTVTINIVTNQLPGGGTGGNGNGGSGAAGGFNSGTFPVSTVPSTLPGDLHFNGTNHTSFLPPTAPSAVGNPF